MLKAGDLKAVIAKSMGLPENKVAYPYRAALDAGLISKGKPGRGGAAVTVRDGALAIIAVTSSYLGEQLIDGIRNFSEAPLVCTKSTISTDEVALWDKESSKWNLPGINLPHFKSLKKDHTFLDALTALIESARDRHFDLLGKKSSHGLKVDFSGPVFDAQIQIDYETKKPVSSYSELGIYIPINISQRAFKKAKAFHIEINIGTDVIYDVANLFRYDGVDEQGRPLDPSHPWNREGTPEKVAKLREEAETYINRRGFS